MNTLRRMSARCLPILLLVFSSWAQASDTGAAIEQTLTGSHRSEANRARDKFRHPRETLLFFGLRPDMQVVEIWPGGGWYTEVLAPVLRDKGRYFAAHYPLRDDTHRFYVNARRNFEKKMAERPEVYGKVTITELLPPIVDIGPKGQVDLVLTFRNVHNWTEQGFAEAMFKSFFEVLKPGGVLGVVEHRAKEGTSLREMNRSGYMTESFVIKLAQDAGFRLDARAEINANPRDTKDHPRGVWTLPPTLRLGDTDREKYLAIGESDRMTLKFVKP